MLMAIVGSRTIQCRAKAPELYRAARRTMIPNFFEIGRAFQDTPEKKPSCSVAETPEKEEWHDSSASPSDAGDDSQSDLAEAGEGQPLKSSSKKEKKQKKHKKQKKVKKWQQGRDKIPDDLPQSMKNDLLRKSFNKNIGSWMKELPDLKHIKETTVEMAGNTIFQLGCAACMSYVAAHPDEKRHRGRMGNKLATGEFGQTGIRKHDLFRHFPGPGGGVPEANFIRMQRSGRVYKCPRRRRR
jgi:hypothetical protein